MGGSRDAGAGLLHVSDDMPGIRRLRCGTGFRYRDARGAPVRDKATLQRIRDLAIPPAYEDVWICASPRGHLQATGRDARGRKQYRYHAAWRTFRDTGKFDRLTAFADALPQLRRRLRADLALEQEQAKADFAAEAEQARIDLDNQLTAMQKKTTHEVSRMRREIEQARIDLDVELSAKRDEAEQELLAAHQEAVAQTQKFVDDANAELAEAVARTAESRAEAERLEAKVRSEIGEVRDRADEEARQRIAEAHEQARKLISDAEERTRALVADAEDRLSQIRIERDAVAGYFESLRGVLSQAQQVAADTK